MTYKLKDHVTEEMLKSVGERRMSKFNYSLELWNEDGEYFALAESFTKEEAFIQSEMYEDDDMPFSKPKKVYMRAESYESDHMVYCSKNDPGAAAYWKFEPQMEKRK